MSGGTGLSLKGSTMLMKSVSLFLASGRRISGSRRRAEDPEEQAGVGGGTSTGAAGSNKTKRGRKPKGAVMDARNVNKLPPKTLETLRKKTHFNKNELEALFQIYRKLIASSLPARKAIMAMNASGAAIAKANTNLDGIDRTMFREILHTTFDLVVEETLAERVWSVWEGSGTTTSSSNMRLESWLTGLSVFLKGTTNEKIAFCFKVYDLNADGYITKDEMFLLLRNSLLKQPGDEDPDEGVRELVELALKKMDDDQDGKVSFDDYKKTVIKEPLLLEAFGQCLPGHAECVAFLDSIQ